MATQRDIAALAAAIYGEARGESRRGKEAVAHVAINRAEIGRVSIPDAVYGSGSARFGQFSFANPQDANANITRNAQFDDPAGWREAVEIAQDVVEGRAKGTKADPTKGATHYHADYVSPSWANDYRKTEKIGTHQFYAAPEREVRGLVQAAAASQHRRADLVEPTAVAGIGGLTPAPTQMAFAPDAGLLMENGVTRALDRMAGSLPAQGLPTPTARPSQAPAFDPDLPPMEYDINRSMGPLFSSMGASRRTSQAAPANLQDVLENEHQRMAGWYGLMTGKPAPAINDAIAKAGTSRERNTPNSQHFAGKALDYGTRSQTDFDKRALVEAGQIADFGGIGLGRNVVHMDTGPRRSWGYGNPTFAGFSTEQVNNAIAQGTLPPGFAVTEARGAPKPAARPAEPGPVEHRSLPGPNVAQSYIDAQRTRAPSMTVAPTPVQQTATPAPAPTAASRAPAPTATPSPSPAAMTPTERIGAAFAAPQAAPSAVATPSITEREANARLSAITQNALTTPANSRDYAMMSSLPAYAAVPRQTMALPPEVAPYSLTQPAPAAAIRARNTRRMSVPAPAPAPAPRPVPPPAVPVPTPPPAPVPTQSPASRPGAPSFAQSMPTGFDVWGGRANVGIAQKGYELSRLDNRNVARYSPQFDRTDVVRQDNSFVRSIDGRYDPGVAVRDQPRDPNAIDGRIGKAVTGLSGKGGLASRARDAAIGFQLGGLPGAAVGAVAGGQIRGVISKALGDILGASADPLGPHSPATLARFAASRQSLNQWAGRGAPAVSADGFPAAPPSPSGSRSNPGDFDFDRAESISPSAASAARSGKAGLF